MHVIDILTKEDHIQLTLFLRSAKRLKNKDVSKARIIEGDALNYNQLKEAKDKILSTRILQASLKQWQRIL